MSATILLADTNVISEFVKKTPDAQVMVWLQTPMSSGEVAPWRRAIKWLQAPAGS